MAGACCGACMASMEMGFVFQLTFEWRESCGQPATHFFDTFTHCVSFRYFDSMRLCPTTKASINPVKPNSLKLTQKAVEKL